MYPIGLLTPSRWVRLAFNALVELAVAVAFFVGGIPIVGAIVVAIAAASVCVRIYADRKVRTTGNVEKVTVPPGPVADSTRKRLNRILIGFSIGLLAAAMILAVLAPVLGGGAETTLRIFSGPLVIVEVTLLVTFRTTMRGLLVRTPRP